jgi:hypothetical protein
MLRLCNGMVSDGNPRICYTTVNKLRGGDRLGKEERKGVGWEQVSLLVIAFELLRFVVARRLALKGTMEKSISLGEHVLIKRMIPGRFTLTTGAASKGWGQDCVLTKNKPCGILCGY